VSKVRAVFLGTPEFAVVSLKKLAKDAHFEIVGVVTQPDRPAGRRLQLTPSPVRSFSLAQGFRVIAPEKINQELILQEIKKWGAEVAIVVAFGQILSQKFLDLFPFGAVNVHGSLLPKWRGAAPIQRALEAGDTETGVALQKIVRELDAGDILGVRKVQVPIEMTALELHDQLAELGADLLQIELMDYVRGHLVPTAQDSSKVTFAKKINKAECEISWSEPALKIHNKARGFLMGPGTFTLQSGKKLKLYKTLPVDSKQLGKKSPQPGTVVRATESELWIQTGEGVLALIEVQPESRSKMKITEFQKGYGLNEGDRLG
jgi:methionyl-tRNA formyltransferase